MAIEEDDLSTEYKLSALPSLYDHFVKLVKYLLENKQGDRDQVILFQDMLEVVTQDIMMEITYLTYWILFMVDLDTKEWSLLINNISYLHQLEPSSFQLLNQKLGKRRSKGCICCRR